MTQDINAPKIRDLILEEVRKRPELADNDKLLTAVIWYKQGWKDAKLYEKLCMVSSPETIRRTRAKLVEEGFITPTPKVKEVRKSLAKKVRNNLKRSK